MGVASERTVRMVGAPTFLLGRFERKTRKRKEEKRAEINKGEKNRKNKEGKAKFILKCGSPMRVKAHSAGGSRFWEEYCGNMMLYRCKCSKTHSFKHFWHRFEKFSGFFPFLKTRIHRISSQLLHASNFQPSKKFQGDCYLRPAAAQFRAIAGPSKKG